MNTKERLLDDLKMSLDAANKMSCRGVIELHQAQYIASQLTQAAAYANQLYGIYLQELEANP